MANKLPINALEEGVLLNLLCPQFCPKSFRLILYKELRDDVLAVGCHYRLLREHYWILQAQNDEIKWQRLNNEVPMQHELHQYEPGHTLTMFEKVSERRCPLNGVVPYMSSYIRIPSDHQSTAAP